MDYQKAAEYKQAIKNRPGDRELLKEAAQYFTDYGAFDEAESCWTKYNDLVGGDAGALKIIGAIHGRKGRHETAQKFLERSIELDPEDADTFHNLAVSLLNLGNVDRSIEYMERSLELDPDDDIGWNDLGVLLFETGRAAGAEECFHKAIDLNPQREEAYINLAQLGDEIIDVNRALKALNNNMSMLKNEIINNACSALAAQAVKMIFEKGREKSSIVLKRSPEEADVSFPDSSLFPGKEFKRNRVGVNIEGRYEFEILPVFEAFELLSRVNEEIMLYVWGKPECELPAWVSGSRRIKWVESLDECDIFIDCRLNISRFSDEPQRVPIKLSPNAEEEVTTIDDKIIVRINTRFHDDYGRTWDFEDLVLMMGATTGCIKDFRAEIE